jgi:hypothetical protein
MHIEKVSSDSIRKPPFFIVKAVKANVYFGTLLNGAEGAKTPAGGQGRGDLAGASDEEAPRTARAWSGNQQANLQSQSKRA